MLDTILFQLIIIFIGCLVLEFLTFLSTWYLSHEHHDRNTEKKSFYF